MHRTAEGISQKLGLIAPKSLEKEPMAEAEDEIRKERDDIEADITNTF